MWTANTESDLAGYRVYRAQTPGTGYVRLNSSLITSPSFTDTAATAGSTFYYAVSAVNSKGQESRKSNEVVATVPASFGPARFTDVPVDSPFYRSIDRIAELGITAGCNSSSYCPDQNLTRAQMAILLLKGMYGSTYTPPATTRLFTDVPSNHWAAAWIEQLYSEGVTSGCGPGKFCPDGIISRAEMAVFIVKARHLSTYYSQLFTDVPGNHWAFAYIGGVAQAGITAGCGGGNYCPDTAVTRGQMAVFLCKAFGL